MILFSFLIFILEIISVVNGFSCYYSYYHCSGYNWCCPDGYVCTGSSTCLSIAAIVGGCIGALVGLGLFIAFIYFVCFRKNRATTGRVIQPQTVGTTNQQYGQPVVTYTQPPSYGFATYPPPPQQQQNGQIVYPPPLTPQLQSDSQTSYPPPPPSLYNK